MVELAASCVAGKRAAGMSAETVSVTSPTTGDAVGSVDVAGAYEVHAAVAAAQLQVGSVAVNSTAVLDFGSPFGSFKKSGVGREGGPEGIAGFVELQAIIR